VIDRGLIYHLAEQCSIAYDDIPSGTIALHDGQHMPRGFACRTVAGGLIAFAGSESILDWLTDFHCIQEKYIDAGYVHRGFNAEWGKVAGQIFKLFHGLPQGYPIQVTGHSLGGALATLAAHPLSRDFGFDVTLVTFGSPRVYDASAAKDLDSLVKKSYRIQHHDDLVPRVPKLNYRHVGNLTRINDDGKEIRFSGILGTLERLWEVEKADLNFSALTDHPIRNYLPAIKNWYNRATLKG
jgi:hypothetical protein